MTEIVFNAMLSFTSTASDFLSSNVSQLAAKSAFAESLGNVSVEDVEIVNVTDVPADAVTNSSDQRRELFLSSKVDVSFAVIMVLEKMGIKVGESDELYQKLSKNLIESVGSGSFERKLQKEIKRLDLTNSTVLSGTSDVPVISKMEVNVRFTAAPSAVPTESASGVNKKRSSHSSDKNNNLVIYVVAGVGAVLGLLVLGFIAMKVFNSSKALVATDIEEGQHGLQPQREEDDQRYINMEFSGPQSPPGGKDIPVVKKSESFKILRHSSSIGIEMPI